MLILTRKPEQTILIGDDIQVTVLSVNSAQVRIGINAPKHLKVDREEVRERKIKQLYEFQNKATETYEVNDS